MNKYIYIYVGKYINVHQLSIIMCYKTTIVPLSNRTSLESEDNSTQITPNNSKSQTFSFVSPSLHQPVHQLSITMRHTHPKNSRVPPGPMGDEII